MAVEIEFMAHLKDGLLLKNAVYKQQYTLPGFVQGDTIALKIGLVEDDDSQGEGYLSELTISGYSCKAAIGTEGGTTLTSATLSVDGSGLRFTGTLPLNTTAVDTLFSGSETSEFVRTFELEFTDGTGTQTIKRKVKLFGELITSTLTDTPSPDTAIGKNEANNLYLKRGENDAGAGFILVSPDGNRKAYIYLTNQGQLDVSPLT